MLLVFVLPGDHNVSLAAEQEQQSFHNALERWRAAAADSSDRGDSRPEPPLSPAPSIILGIVSALAAKDVGARNRQRLIDLLSRLEKGPPTDDPNSAGVSTHTRMFHTIPSCRTDRCADEGRRKISIATTGLQSADRELVCAAMNQGAEHKVGPAPLDGSSRM